MNLDVLTISIGLAAIVTVVAVLGVTYDSHMIHAYVSPEHREAEIKYLRLSMLSWGLATGVTMVAVILSAAYRQTNNLDGNWVAVICFGVFYVGTQVLFAWLSISHGKGLEPKHA